jgi:hypothetical protein
MWTLCNDAQRHIVDHVWLESRAGDAVLSKAKIRELTYRALIDSIERRGER